MATQTLTPEQELARLEAAKKARDEEKKRQDEADNARIEELKKQTREADMVTVKELCARHGFTATDLRGFLKTRGAKKGTPRKSPIRKTGKRKPSKST